MASDFAPSNGAAQYDDGLWYAWSATVLAPLMECPQKWQWATAEGRKRPARALDFGKAAHAGWETLDYWRLKAAPKEEALDRALKRALWFADQWTTPAEPRRTRDMLGRLLTAYADELYEGAVQPVEREGRAANEDHWKLPGGTYPDGRPWVLCGSLDSRVTFAGQHYVRERKTTTAGLQTYWKSYVPRVQLWLYDWAESIMFPQGHAGVILEVARIGETKTWGPEVEFDRRIFARSAWQRGAFLMSLNAAIARYWGQWKADKFLLNETACGNYGGCPFRRACDAPTEAERQVVLDMEQPRGVVFNPLA